MKRMQSKRKQEIERPRGRSWLSGNVFKSSLNMLVSACHSTV